MYVGRERFSYSHGCGADVSAADRPPRRPARPPTARAATEPSTPITKGKRSGQHAFIGRAAQGQRGGGMRALGVFENWAGKCAGRFE